jgi:hypothetical protein
LSWIGIPASIEPSVLFTMPGGVHAPSLVVPSIAITMTRGIPSVHPTTWAPFVLVVEGAAR